MLLDGALATLALVVVHAVRVELRRGQVQQQRDVLAGGLARLLDRAHDELQRQEFMIAPVGVENFEEPVRVASEVFHTLRKTHIPRHRHLLQDRAVLRPTAANPPGGVNSGSLH